MRALLLAAVALLLAATAPAQTYITENLTSDATWTVAGSPYIVQGVISLEAPTTLTINPGVVVKMDSGAHLRTRRNSRITAIGEEGNEILFTSASVAPAAGDWYAVYTREDSTSVFYRCVFEYGQYDLYADRANPAVTNCTLRYASNSGLSCESGSPVVEGCDIIDNYRGVTIYGPDALPGIHGCNLYNNSGYNMYVAGFDPAPRVTINAEDNWWGVDTYLEIDETISISMSSAPYVDVDFDPWLHEVPVEEVSWARVKALYR
jgi:hypothetical protein